MEISGDKYRLLQIILDSIEGAQPKRRSLMSHVNKVRNAIFVSEGGPVFIEGGREVAIAIAQLIERRDESGRPGHLTQMALNFWEEPQRLVERVLSLDPNRGLWRTPLYRGELQQRIDNYVLATLLLAILCNTSPPADLAGAGRPDFQAMRGDPYRRTFAEALFSNSPTLRAIPPKILDDRTKIARYLILFRDRIAKEDMASRGGVLPYEFKIPRLLERYTLRKLLGALAAGRMIGQQRVKTLWTTVAFPLDYFFPRREALEPEMLRVNDLGINRSFAKHVDRRLFPRIKDESKLLLDAEVASVVKWGIWVVTNPDLIMRSLYGADELVDAKDYRGSGDNMGRLITGSIKASLTKAARLAGESPYLARRRAVEALMEVLDNRRYFEKAGGMLHGDEIRHLDHIARLVDWNRDALEYDPRKRSVGGGGVASATISPKLEYTPFGLGASMLSALKLPRMFPAFLRSPMNFL